MPKIILFLCLVSLLTHPVLGQDYRFDQDLLPISFHVKNREHVRQMMPEHSVAIFFANPEQVRSNDVYYEYHQDPNFFYLTGFTEPNSVLLIFKDTFHLDSFVANEFLFIPPKSSKDELWTGSRMGVDVAKSYLQCPAVLSNQQFADLPFHFEDYTSLLLLPEAYEKPAIDDKYNRGDLASLKKHFNLKTEGLDSIKNTSILKDIMAQLREIKSPEEISLMQNAILITCKAQKELMKALLPGKHEYSAEAIVEYIFKEQGAEQPGFPSILGGGQHSCVLHYTSNRKILDFDDLLVSDIGAEYHYYTADVTRTMPASGKFSEEQKIIYNIVLEAQEAGIKACLKGNKFWQPHEEAKKVIQDRLFELGIITEKAQYKTYFMHGTSHYLGLDVHDAGTFQFLKPGNVITVEPGIYIPEGSACDPKWWNIGVRIEDDVLITNTEPEVLSDCVPKTIPEIEKIMEEKSLFNKFK